MPKFFRRQMPIDAVQYDGSPESRVAIKHLAAGWVCVETPTPTLTTSSLGTVLVINGDLIVHEKINKEYPFTLFSPRAFEATFEPTREPCSQ